MKEYQLETKKKCPGADSRKRLSWSNEPSTRGIPHFHVAECLLCRPGKPHLKLNFTLKQGCWNWNSNTLATWLEELTEWKRPWCWERLKVGGEGDDRKWEGWMASLTQWTWVWVSSGSWWWIGKPGMLQSMGSQRVRHDWATELNWTDSFSMLSYSHFSRCYSNSELYLEGGRTVGVF